MLTTLPPRKLAQYIQAADCRISKHLESIIQA